MINNTSAVSLCRCGREEKMKKRIIILGMIALLIIAAIPGTAEGIAGLVKVPDPLSGENPLYPESAGFPAVGEAFSDSGLGTRCMRVTATPGVRHEYARFDPFNADKSFILLYDYNIGAFNVHRTVIPYDAPGNFLCRLDMEEPRWDPGDPRLLTGLNGLRILRCDVTTGSVTVVKDFSLDPVIGPVIAAESDLYRITTKEKGECSMDGRWWALMLQGSADDYRPRYLFTWDRDTDTVPGLYALEESVSRIGWIGMSALGNWVVLGCESDNGAPLTGVVIANRDFSGFHKISSDDTHSDVGLDSAGNEVIVMQNSGTDYIDMVLLDPSTRAVTGSNGEPYGDSGHTPLVRLYYDNDSPFGFISGIHISCNAPGWALVSTFTAPGTPEHNWLDKSIALVRLDTVSPDWSGTEFADTSIV